MAPSAVDEKPIGPPEAKTYPPAHIFPVKETRFEKYIDPQEDGRKRALENPDTAAIVIDNGITTHETLTPNRKHNLTPLPQAPLPCEPAGLSSRPRASASPPSCPSTGTESSERPSPLPATTATPTRRPEATSETPSRPAPASSATGMSWSTSSTTSSSSLA